MKRCPSAQHGMKRCLLSSVSSVVRFSLANCPRLAHVSFIAEFVQENSFLKFPGVFLRKFVQTCPPWFGPACVGYVTGCGRRVLSCVLSQTRPTHNVMRVIESSTQRAPARLGSGSWPKIASLTPGPWGSRLAFLVQGARRAPRLYGFQMRLSRMSLRSLDTHNFSCQKGSFFGGKIICVQSKKDRERGCPIK